VCFRHGPLLFAGEAAGTYATLGRGDDTPEPYLRPATPPVFKLEVAQESLDRLLALEPAPEQLLFAHHGRHRGAARRVLGEAREQLGLWVETMREVAAADGGLPADEEEAGPYFERVVAALDGRDPRFARRNRLADDLRAREEDFTIQTLRGMLDYLNR
jgi:hypothetical protein